MMKTKHLCFVMLLFCGITFAQTQVSGVVSDAVGPLAGASVVVKGTTTGATTDFDGNFSLTAPDNAVLVFSYIGYSKQEVPVAGKTTINVILEEDAEALDEVVVTALGFTVDKKTLGSTYSEIDADAAQQSGETGVINSLAGKASGVKISRSNGDPGAGSTIQIRGANTITGNTQPLVIVDGIPFSNETTGGIGNDTAGGVSQQSRLNDINPNDIESINILKGASAAAVWGAQAANGVLVITTKKGRSKNKIDVSFNSTLSVDQVNIRHPLQNTFGQGSNGRFIENTTTSWGDKISDRAGGADVLDTSGQYFEAADGSSYYPILTKNSRDTFVDSNFDNIFRTGTSLENNISVSGAGDKGDFYLSLGKLNNEGIVKSSYYDKTNITINTTYKFNDWLSVRAKTNYIKIKSNRTQQSSNSNGVLLGLLRNSPDFDITDYIGTYYDAQGAPTELKQRSYRNNYGSKDNSGYNNPRWATEELENLNNVDRYVVNLEATLRPVDWLTVIARGGIDNYNDVRTSFFPIYSSSTRSDGEYSEEFRESKNVTFDLLARANAKLSEDFGSSYTLGFGHNNRKSRAVYAEARNFLFNTRLKDFQTLSVDATTSTINSKQFFKSDRVFGVASFDYIKKVYLNLSGAYETFSSASSGVFYPAADVSWDFADDFESSFLSYGKLRGSAGQVGVAPQSHKFNTTYEVFTVSGFDDPLDINLLGGGFRYNDDRGNAELRPEIKTEYEIGTDLKFFKNRFSLNLTYYTSKVTDVLFDVGLSPSTGHNEQYRNAGELENKGLEIDWDLAFLRNEDYRLSVYGNFNNNKNKVLDLAGTESIDLTSQSVSSRAVQGEAVGVLWGTRALRNDDGTLALNEFGFPQIGSEGIIGDPNPDWRGSLGLRGNYKNFRVNVLFETSQGGDFAERTRFILANFGTHAEVGNEVTLSQDLSNINGTVYTAGSTVRGNIGDFGAGPVVLDQAYYSTIQGFGDSVIGEFAVSDGSWTRFREISFGYTLASDKFKKSTGLSSIDFSLTGRNLHLWTKEVVGSDPEINQFGVSNGFGIEYFTNPSTKSYVFSLKIAY